MKCDVDTALAEEIMNYTMTDDFNRILEVQQSRALGCTPLMFME